MANVGTTPVSIGSSSYLIQNLGPDDLFVGDENVDSAEGIKVVSGGGIVVGATDRPVYVVSVGTSDVRTLSRGMGMILPAAATP